MGLHGDARLGLVGRSVLVLAIGGGCLVRVAVRRRGVLPATVCTWSQRWQRASEEGRRTLVCLFGRLSPPCRSRRLLDWGRRP